MLTLSGIYLLVVLGPGTELGMKQMPSMNECRAQAQTYLSQPRFTSVQCLENPVIGSPTVATNQLFDLLHGVLRHLEDQR